LHFFFTLNFLADSLIMMLLAALLSGSICLNLHSSFPFEMLEWYNIPAEGSSALLLSRRWPQNVILQPAASSPHHLHVQTFIWIAKTTTTPLDRPGQAFILHCHQ
jgi:hypothetical protein